MLRSLAPERLPSRRRRHGPHPYGALKGRLARMALVRSGLQVPLVGGESAGMGYLIGSLGPRLVGA